MADGDGWEEWKIYILKSLDKIEGLLAEMAKEQECLAKEIIKLDTWNKILASIVSVIFSALIGIILKIILRG